MSKKRRANQKNFKPGDRVIWFKTTNLNFEPVLAWVPREKFYRSVTRHQVRVTRHEGDAQEGKGQSVNQGAVYPFNETLWASCEEWLENRGQLRNDLKVLMKGKKPDGYLAYIQGEFNFDESS